MKKLFKSSVNKILKTQGVIIARIHEIEFLERKYLNLIAETEGFFAEKIFVKLPHNSQRLSLLAKLNGTEISEAFYLLHYLNSALDLKGDICEFGVGDGATSALIANEIKSSHKILWLFDSFQGLSKPTKKDRLINDIFALRSMEKYEGTMSYTQEDVKKKLREVRFPLKKTKIISGFIEESLKSTALPKQVAFAYVDFDLYGPTKTALEFLDKSLVAGGYIVVDDYGYFSAGVKTAVQEFLKEKPRAYKFTKPYNFAGHFCILEKRTDK